MGWGIENHINMNEQSPSKSNCVITASIRMIVDTLTRCWLKNTYYRLELEESSLVLSGEREMLHILQMAGMVHGSALPRKKRCCLLTCKEVPH